MGRPEWIALATAAVVGLVACDQQPRNLLEEPKLYSQGNEELIIRDFFQDRRDGFFLDVGCAWPRRNSTTYYLEKHLGWSGIAIDALAEYEPGWKQWRPASRFFVFLVTDHSDSVDRFYRAPWPGVSSVEKERMLKGEKIVGTEIQVPSITLNKLLDDNGITEIDFLSMDIERHEPAALAGFDIERFAPELVCIEAAPETREAILDYFGEHGYRRIERYRAHDPVNWYFRPQP